MIGVLVLDELNYRAVLELSHEQLSLVLLRKLKCDLYDSATILIFSQLDHIAMDLIDYYSFVHWLAMLQQLLNDIICEDVDDELLKVREAFGKDQLTERLMCF